MANLIKMDMRRLFMSKLFYVTMGITAFLNMVIMTAIPLITKMFAPEAEASVTKLSDILANPFAIPWMLIAVYISMVSFSYADMANGYIKNIAGQIPRKSDTVVSKFVVIGVHNLVFFAVSALSMVLGNVIGSAFGTFTIEADSMIMNGILTLLLKWLLSMAICSILLLLTTGVRNKTLAAIVGVVFGTNTMALVYMGLNTAVANIFKTESFNLAMYMPDGLMGAVNVTAGTGVINAIVVSVVCISVFFALTIKVFNSRDIK